ncbi:MAG TPA: FAD-binding protein [Candidatus Atribacteria bacterium]|nr:FAD-binding protein [Candidatus Atribacteria bacterium]
MKRIDVFKKGFLEFDILIIGTGGAGLRVAIEADQNGCSHA